MNALSRREEENLLKITKERAVKECHEVVKAFADCVQGRTISVAWACRPQLHKMEECIVLYTGPEPYERVRTEYLRLRAEQRVAKLRDSDS
ncbi:cytochrome c oxidase biogenesis protein Cmc1 like-domain-containing protein [Mycena olivaceomarginata]|uniref:COX assembly mitochondrial protein n=1 Tax=Mycena albidolilacea TaxID=1033008 RepID=A0AAD7AL14_9AGAR|nr:cytochrome c oxidase biogenesis protein Cmc1 like-domain-containing protein [Mycena albidolilacea]KAJ7808276.1 cytochrome c oxidase biogenesis protein Cmc1 like-domain-containing protein [Mycena olivaceomarginata]